MLLAIDIGNTNICAALINEEKIISKSYLPTDLALKKNAILTFFNNLFTYVNNSHIEEAVIGSVVPSLNDQIQGVLSSLNISSLLVSPELKFSISVPDEVKNVIGADILATNEGAGAYAADCIVVDIGTATTFQVISDKRFIGGVISAGMDISAKALHTETALLPNVTPAKPKTIFGFDTIECIKSGVFYGQVAMIEGMIKRIENEQKKSVTIIGTGGAAEQISKELFRPFDILDKDLIFKGLKIIYNANQEKLKHAK